MLTTAERKITPTVNQESPLYDFIQEGGQSEKHLRSLIVENLKAGISLFDMVQALKKL